MTSSPGSQTARITKNRKGLAPLAMSTRSGVTAIARLRASSAAITSRNAATPALGL